MINSNNSHFPTLAWSNFFKVLVGLLLLGIFDLSNLDRSVYQLICNFLSRFSQADCVVYYDVPFWVVMSVAGSLAVVYFAYKSIVESRRQLDIEQRPHVVMKDRIGTAGDENRLHNISLKNVGRGAALNIRATADPKGKVSMIEGSNPNMIELGSGEYNSGWAVDEGQVIKGLQMQGIDVKFSVDSAIPDEKNLPDDEKEKSEFKLFLWYDDQIGSHYVTETIIRHSGVFFKVMRNTVTKMGERSHEG